MHKNLHDICLKGMAALLAQNAISRVPIFELSMSPARWVCTEADRANERGDHARTLFCAVALRSLPSCLAVVFAWTRLHTSAGRDAYKSDSKLEGDSNHEMVASCYRHAVIL